MAPGRFMMHELWLKAGEIEFSRLAYRQLKSYCLVPSCLYWRVVYHDNFDMKFCIQATERLCSCSLIDYVVERLSLL